VVTGSSDLFDDFLRSDSRRGLTWCQRETLRPPQEKPRAQTDAGLTSALGRAGLGARLSLNDAPLCLVPRMNLRPSDRPIWAACALNWVMIGITISGRAYAAIAATLPAASAAEKEIASDGEYLVWLPRAVVNRLRALREPEETFSEVILRLRDRGTYAALTRSTGDSGSNT
jgi:hypothetical protein